MAPLGLADRVLDHLREPDRVGKVSEVILPRQVVQRGAGDHTGELLGGPAVMAAPR